MITIRVTLGHELTGRRIEQLLRAVGEPPRSRRPQLCNRRCGRGLTLLRNLVARRVARDFQLSEDWMNSIAARQWPDKLPAFLFVDISWRRYAGLEVGLVSRSTLIALKLHAAVDQDVRSVHYSDLLTLQPTDQELETAREVVLKEDAGPDFPNFVDGVVSRVKKDTRRNR